MKKIFLIIFLGGLLLPSVSLAVSYNTYKTDGKTVIYEGLVPCGNEVCIYSGTETAGEFLEFLELLKVDHPDFTFEKNCEGLGGEWKSIPCQFCHFFVMFRGILDFVLKLVIIIGVLMLTIGGFMFLFAGGSPKILDSAKRVLTSTVIGLVIIFAAWLIVNSILTFPGFINPQFGWDPTKWFQVECSIKPFVEEEVAPEEEEEEEEKEEKIVLIKINYPTSWGYSKTCKKLCEETGFTCENVGTDEDALNKHMWDGNMFDGCLPLSLSNIDCDTQIKSAVWTIDCPPTGEKRYHPQWTRCKCVKTEWR